MKCPICEQGVLRSRRPAPGRVWVRCLTDGDYLVAEDTLPLLAGLPLATRHLALNVAIIDRQSRALPLIDASAVVKGSVRAEEIGAAKDGG